MKPISKLLYKKLLGEISTEEQATLNQWKQNNEKRQALYNRVTDPKEIGVELRLRSIINRNRAEVEMERRIKMLDEHSKQRNGRRLWFVFGSVAASVLLFIGTFLFFNTPTLNMGTEEIAVIQSINEIVPGVTKATLSDESGNVITLTNSDTKPTFSATTTHKHSKTEKIKDLCLNVPRGAEFKIVLEDSTQVWLNSASTLHYPEKFGNSERRVKISGEAYFVVAKDSIRPFLVETQEQVVRVYGTRFNVRDYQEDRVIYTTLESGSISLRNINSESGEVFLSPGNQSVYSVDNSIMQIRDVNPQEICGWRLGKFVFEEQKLSTIMQDLSRWYNFEYEFSDPSVSELVFMGSIPRYADFATAAEILENSGIIKFEVINSKVIILHK